MTLTAESLTDRDRQAMQHSILFSSAHKCFEVKVLGIVDHMIMIAIIDEVVRDGRFSGSTGIIWDFREASLSNMTLDCMRAVWAAQKSLGIPETFRIASVLSHRINDPVLRLWELAAPTFHVMDRRYFADIDEARRWVAAAPGAGAVP